MKNLLEEIKKMVDSVALNQSKQPYFFNKRTNDVITIEDAAGKNLEEYILVHPENVDEDILLVEKAIGRKLKKEEKTVGKGGKRLFIENIDTRLFIPLYKLTIAASKRIQPLAAKKIYRETGIMLTEHIEKERKPRKKKSDSC
ncbi:hypothetical protein DMA11_16965 [Marinilabiliaceae bacterium JC017]|nr:hypothetical protein DMA11_16965 [Marinilabiliaceae bacterium JC017]